MDKKVHWAEQMQYVLFKLEVIDDILMDDSVCYLPQYEGMSKKDKKIVKEIRKMRRNLDKMSEKVHKYLKYIGNVR